MLRKSQYIHNMQLPSSTWGLASYSYTSYRARDSQQTVEWYYATACPSPPFSVCWERQSREQEIAPSAESHPTCWILFKIPQNSGEHKHLNNFESEASVGS
ncbi:hypothetical protein I79_002492 [Cricetulus griseus]|uniref:Uncharacterized protein n=1 Tax=Cricetulus griseus TaxID=10029 RepID=G3GXK0_CRIGR|nr:hypothetical protein I79_002492 [Cricetulus griseus]